MSTGLTSLIISIFILIHSTGLFHSFPCFSYLSHRFDWNLFFLISRNYSPLCLSLQSSLAIPKAYFPSWYISTHSLCSSSFGDKRSCYRFLIHGSSFHLLSPSYFTPILHRNALMLHHDYLLSSIFSRIVYLL